MLQRLESLVLVGRRWGEPEDVATAIVTLAKGDIPFATGIHVDIAGGLQLHRI